MGAMVGTREWHFLSPTVGASAVTDLPRAFPPAPGGMVVGKGGKQPCVPWEGGRRVPASNHARNCPPKAKTLVSPCPATAQPMRGRSAQPMRSRPLGVLQWAPVQGSPPASPPSIKAGSAPFILSLVGGWSAGVGQGCGVRPEATRLAGEITGCFSFKVNSHSCSRLRNGLQKVPPNAARSSGGLLVSSLSSRGLRARGTGGTWRPLSGKALVSQAPARPNG